MSQEDTVPRGPIEAMERGTWLKIRDQHPLVRWFLIDVNKEKKSETNRFLGPGPARYQLPPAIGVPNHDPRKWKAPAYTLTGGAKPFKGTGVPGTVYIVINSYFRKC